MCYQMPNLGTNLAHSASFSMSLVSPRGVVTSGFSFSALHHLAPCIKFSFAPKFTGVFYLCWRCHVMFLSGNCLDVPCPKTTRILSSSCTPPWNKAWAYSLPPDLVISPFSIPLPCESRLDIQEPVVIAMDQLKCSQKYHARACIFSHTQFDPNTIPPCYMFACTSG